MIDDEMRTMVLDYMEKGFLENIIDMFRHDAGLYPLIADMLRDERIRVRLGAAALVEELVATERGPFIPIIPDVASLLSSSNPTERADAAYILGLIGHRDALQPLLRVMNDDHPQAREVIREAISDIEAAAGNAPDRAHDRERGMTGAA